MTDATDDDDNATGTASGSGKSGKSGKTGGGGGGIRLPPDKLKEVMSNWEYLDVNKVVARAAEFFVELPARASAHMQVSWAGVHKDGFAIVTQILKFGQEVSHLIHNLTRENADILRQRYGIHVSGPSG